MLRPNCSSLEAHLHQKDPRVYNLPYLRAQKGPDCLQPSRKQHLRPFRLTFVRSEIWPFDHRNPSAPLLQRRWSDPSGAGVQRETRKRDHWQEKEEVRWWWREEEATTHATWWEELAVQVTYGGRLRYSWSWGCSGSVYTRYWYRIGD